MTYKAHYAVLVQLLLNGRLVVSLVGEENLLAWPVLLPGSALMGLLCQRYLRS